MGTDRDLSSLENPSDPQYNYSAHQVSTTNVSKKSFNMSNRNVHEIWNGTVVLIDG